MQTTLRGQATLSRLPAERRRSLPSRPRKLTNSAVSLKLARSQVESEQVNAYPATAQELHNDAMFCHACQAELSSDLDLATSEKPVLLKAPTALKSTRATGIAIAALVLAIGVGFLIPILCSVLAIGIGVVALRSSNGKSSAVKRLAIASVLLGLVGVLGAIAVLSGA